MYDSNFNFFQYVHVSKLKNITLTKKCLVYHKKIL